MKTMLSKLTSVLLCLAMLLTMCSFAMAEAGTYTGVGDSEIGGKGAIEVSVTVDENGVVTDIQVTKNGDTAGIADAAVEAMPGRIMAAQSANVDGVSGATMTSEAIKMAVLDAVTAAGLDTVKWSTYVSTEAAKADDATYNTDIVIVGAGGAGMTAALTAADKGAEFITVFYGDGVTQEDAQRAEQRFADACPEAEVSMLPGGQPVYYYIISIE